MNSEIRILILEDNASDAELVKRELRRAGFTFTSTVAQDKPGFLHSLDESIPDLVLADYSVPGFGGMAALSLAKERIPNAPVIIVSGAIGEETAIEFLKAGATDYVLKQRLDRLGPVIDRALREAQEINERKQAQKAILQAKDEWERTFDTVPDLIAILNCEHRIIRVNRAMAERLGVKPEQAVGLQCYEAVHGGNEPPAFCPHALTCQDGKEHIAEVHEPQLGGDFIVSTTPMFDAQGQITGAVHVARDITDRKLAEDRLLKEKTFSETAINSMPGVFYLFKETGPLLRWNQNFEDVTEYSSDEIARMGPLDFFDAAERQPIADAIAKVFTEGSVTVEADFCTKTGRKVPFYLTGLLMCSNDETYLIGAGIDVTERRRARLALEEAYHREHYIAEVLQRALAPIKPTIGDGYRAAAAYRSAYEGQEIGGDFYDVFNTEDGKVGILIGDISGKGIEAAARAAATRSTIRAFAFEASSPAQALTRANSVLYPEHHGESFATVLLAILDLPSGKVVFANAGHPLPAVGRATGDVESLTGSRLPIGLLERVEYVDDEFQLGPGDKMVFYTDGISESRYEGALFGVEGIENTMKEHGDKTMDRLVGEIMAAADRWSHGRHTDDATIVVIERCPTA